MFIDSIGNLVCVLRYLPLGMWELSGTWEHLLPQKTKSGAGAPFSQVYEMRNTYVTIVTYFAKAKVLS